MLATAIPHVLSDLKCAALGQHFFKLYCKQESESISREAISSLSPLWILYQLCNAIISLLMKAIIAVSTQRKRYAYAFHQTEIL
jgi:hypothetical protein